MFEEQTEEVRRRLSNLLKTSIGAERAKEYLRLWNPGVNLLAKKCTSIPQYFRDVLLLTRRMCNRFSIGPENSRHIRKAVLDGFLQVGNLEDEGGTTTTTQAESERTAKHIIFHALLDGFCDAHDSKTGAPGNLKREFTASIERLAASSRTKLVMERWSTTDVFPGNFDRIPLPDMQLAIDLIYSIIDDLLGTTTAESIVAQVARNVENLPEAEIFPPRGILDVTIHANLESDP